MNRRDLVLAMLACSEGRPYTPVQIQKAIFMITRNMPQVLDEGVGFDFQPYDYGPFDADVYSEAHALSRAGEAVIAPSNHGRWQTYACSDLGLERGRKLLESLSPKQNKYVQEISSWVRSLSFTSLVKSIYDAYPEMKENSIFQG
jgi:hypothetical protein